MNKKLIFLGLAAIGAAVGVALVIKKRKEVKNMNDIEVIGKSEYNSDKFYRKRILKYYILDDTLVDNYKHQIISNGNELLGPDWEDDHKVVFRMQANLKSDGEYLYIRNHKKHIDYCIIDVKGSYASSDAKEDLESITSQLNYISKTAHAAVRAKYELD